MRNILRIGVGILLGTACLAGRADAQFKNGNQATELNLPTLSQRATVTQRIGLTDITIVYHEPLVGGREIWGKVVPYGQVWRSGANENTTIILFRRCERGRKGATGWHVRLTHDSWQRGVDGDFFKKLDFLGQLFVRRKRRCAACDGETPAGRVSRSPYLYVRRR